LKNYANDFDNDIANPRYAPIHFLRLIEDVENYNRHKNANTGDYQQLSNFLWSIRSCESSEQILYELKFRGIEGIPQTEPTDFSETYRIWRQFLQKAYWRD